MENKSDRQNEIASQVLDDATKRELYAKSLKEITTQLATLEKGIIVPRMSTVTAVLKSIMPHYIWCGFYFSEEKEMVVGPYQGVVACPNIAYTGVCGTAAKKGETLIVPDVHAFPGHIVCDERANSEIVVPIKDKEGRVIGVFDIDSGLPDAFNEVDKEFLENLVPLLLE